MAKSLVNSKIKIPDILRTAKASEVTERYCARSLYKHHDVISFIKQTVAQII